MVTVSRTARVSTAQFALGWLPRSNPTPPRCRRPERCGIGGRCPLRAHLAPLRPGPAAPSEFEGLLESGGRYPGPHMISVLDVVKALAALGFERFGVLETLRRAPQDERSRQMSLRQRRVKQQRPVAVMFGRLQSSGPRVEAEVHVRRDIGQPGVRQRKLGIARGRRRQVLNGALEGVPLHRSAGPSARRTVQRVGAQGQAPGDQRPGSNPGLARCLCRD